MRILENQSDFLHEKSQLEIEISKSGDESTFYSNFYCKLNYIEYYRGAVKRHARKNCNYSFIELEHTVRTGFDSIS